MASKKQLVASALIPDDLGRIFVQQRTLTRRLFPGCWDLVGGHVEEDEDVISALTREIREETGWTLRTIRHEISVKAWRHWCRGNAQPPSKGAALPLNRHITVAPGSRYRAGSAKRPSPQSPPAQIERLQECSR